MERIPSNERKWVIIRSDKKKNYHIITSKKDSRSRFYLYNCQDGKVEKLASSKSPDELENNWPL